MSRRKFTYRLAGVLVALTALPLAASAQSPERMWRLAVLTPTAASLESIRNLTLPELAALGYIEGRNLIVDARSADNKFDRLPDLARDVVANDPDVIIANATRAIVAARGATSSIPIIMAFAGEDPVAAGWVKSLSKPGTNLTGLVMLGPELEKKRLELLHQSFPERRQVAVLTLGDASQEPHIRALSEAATALGINLVLIRASGTEDYPIAFATMRSTGAEALVIPSATIYANDRSQILSFALEAKLPTVCEFSTMAHSGCLLSYGANLPELRRRTAHFAARILGGTPPGELPIERPTKFDTVVNLKTAELLGVEIPPEVVAQADEVIE